MKQDEKGLRCKVVMNSEEQYSIWPLGRVNALGWRDTGKSGSKEECLAYIKEVWTDMLPLTLRKRHENTIPVARRTLSPSDDDI
jgi:MbtH protein